MVVVKCKWMPLDVQCSEEFLSKHSLIVIAAIVAIISVPCLSLGLIIIPAFSILLDTWVFTTYAHNKG